MSKINGLTRSQLLEIVLDNTKDSEVYQKQGILQFGKLLFPDLFRNNFGELHYHMTQLYFQLYSPHRKVADDRKGYYLVHREGAKSTIASKLIPLYAIYLKGFKPVIKVWKEGWEGGTGIGKWDYYAIENYSEKYILICSETSSSAVDFVMDIKSRLEERGDLANVFGEKNPKYMEDDDSGKHKDKKWTQSLFVTSDKTVVRGVGAGQQVRGRQLYGYRPTLEIIDDMYSENNVKTAERIEGLANWFYRSLLNSLDSEEGKAMWLGTAVHPEIVALKDFVKEGSDWFGVRRPIISPEELAKAITMFSKKGKLVMPSYDEAINAQDEFISLSWPDRHNLYKILKKYKGYVDKGDYDGFYQEYMNEPIAPMNKVVEPDSFKPMNFKTYKQRGQQMIECDFDGIHWKGFITLNIGVDLASSLNKGSDDTVIMVAGYARLYPFQPGMDWESSVKTMPQGKIHPFIVDCKAGKYDIHEYADRPGSAETLLKLCNKYFINRIYIEANGQQELAIREIRKYFEENGKHSMIRSEYVSEKKAERIYAVLLPLVQKYKSFYCAPGDYIEKLFQQTLLLRQQVAHDDYPDALEECFKHPVYPDNLPLPGMERNDNDDDDGDRPTDLWYWL